MSTLVKPSTQKGTPLATKTTQQETPMAAMDLDMDLNNKLKLDPKLVKEIADKQLVHRWINASKYKQNWGYDARHWTPYKRAQNTGAVENNSYGFTDSEGHIRRGDLILAVRPKALHDKARDIIRNKNKILQGSHTKQSADQLRQTFKEAQMTDKAKVFEGYEENDGKE